MFGKKYRAKVDLNTIVSFAIYVIIGLHVIILICKSLMTSNVTSIRVWTTTSQNFSALVIICCQSEFCVFMQIPLFFMNAYILFTCFFQISDI